MAIRGFPEWFGKPTTLDELRRRDAVWTDKAVLVALQGPHDLVSNAEHLQLVADRRALLDQVDGIAPGRVGPRRCEHAVSDHGPDGCRRCSCVNAREETP